MDGIGGATIHLATQITSSSLFRFLQIRWPGDELGGEGIVGERRLERSRQGSQCKLLQGEQHNARQWDAMQLNAMKRAHQGYQCKLL